MDMFSNTIASVRRYEWGPNGVGRGLLMDFGFGDVLKKTEEHFGAWAVTFLICCIMLGGFLWVLNGVVGVVVFIEGVANKSPFYALLRIVVNVGLILLIGWLGLFWMSGRTRKKIEVAISGAVKDSRKRRAELDRYAAQLDHYSAEIIARGEASIEECRATHKVCEDWMEKIEKLSEERRTDSG